MNEMLCIIGSGVVGKAMGRGFEEKGYKVTYVDTKEDIVARLRALGKSAYTPEGLRNSGMKHDVYFLTVSTPTEDGKINLSYLESATKNLGALLSTPDEYCVIVVKSTVPPGTTETLVINNIEAISGKRVGIDFGVCMSPEYLREASAEQDFTEPWIIVIGEYDQRSGDALQNVYNAFNSPIFRTTLQEAEMQKYVHNLFNATKITFFNEMRGVCERLGLDADTIFPLVAKSAEGMWNPNYGIRNLGSYSGSCLPKDTQAFLKWTKDKDFEAVLLEAVIKVNNTFKRQVEKKETS